LSSVTWLIWFPPTCASADLDSEHNLVDKWHKLCSNARDFGVGPISTIYRYTGGCFIWCAFKWAN
jgi:hypothetical protein